MVVCCLPLVVRCPLFVDCCLLFVVSGCAFGLTFVACCVRLDAT